MAIFRSHHFGLNTCWQKKTWLNHHHFMPFHNMLRSPFTLFALIGFHDSTHYEYTMQNLANSSRLRHNIPCLYDVHCAALRKDLSRYNNINSQGTYFLTHLSYGWWHGGYAIHIWLQLLRLGYGHYSLFSSLREIQYQHYLSVCVKFLHSNTCIIIEKRDRP